MRLLIAGGGTGGHIYPALAVARSLRDPRHRARRDVDLRWLGGHRGLESSLVPAAGIPFTRLLLRSLRLVQRDAHFVLDPVRLGASIPQVTALLVRERPAAIFTTGGYVAVPVMLAAAPLRIPVVLWEGNVNPGKSVRFTSRLAHALAVAFEPTCEALAGAGRPCYVTGTPIRDTRDVDRAAAREHLRIPTGDRVMLIFGGSQTVRRFNRAVADALPALVERVAVIHVTGQDGYADALGGRNALAEPLRARYQPHPYLQEDMLLALAAADLVVGRAGSSTLAEVAALGLPTVVVPYPHASGHQRANAEALVAAGAARLVEDEAFDATALLAAADLLYDAVAHLGMSAAARGLGRPGAADAVAELVFTAAERRALPAAEALTRLARGAP
jgi:UDP-N-acetylglucosamine--N-acetylmuramyl-(pentapeptide) pyrophosphoryl-undecaprenol N-acetylglucosamine transferase